MKHILNIRKRIIILLASLLGLSAFVSSCTKEPEGPSESEMYGCPPSEYQEKNIE